MNGILGHNSGCKLGYTEPLTTWANEMTLSVNHAPDAGSIKANEISKYVALLITFPLETLVFCCIV